MDRRTEKWLKLSRCTRLKKSHVKYLNGGSDETIDGWTDKWTICNLTDRPMGRSGNEEIQNRYFVLKDDVLFQ